MSNHLKNQSSPYLLQHMENPVDWYPWCEEAFEKAAGENKPVFLSIGYSTCHWCHVMAHESFENKETAELLNRYFVSVKVDREERPDIDSVYMSVCQALTGNGGWPMSIFMTADQKPFFAGTYFPPASRHGMIGFPELLLTIAKEWKHNKTKLLESADEILSHITMPEQEADREIDRKLPERAAGLFSRIFDEKYGGFGDAPKFPTPHNLIFLTLYSQQNRDKAAFSQVEITLEKLRRGGIFDHIGYGFSRYSTDRYFLIPHFEKMLYDNALLIIAYCAAYKASGNQILLDTAEKTAEYVFREMQGESGELYSAQDADSEGAEGKFYVFRHQEICGLLGEERGSRFCAYFGITRQGNFEGKNIPNLLNGNPITDAFDEERKALYEYRKSRTRLHLDDKVLTTWNSLMICALAILYRVTGKSRYLMEAVRTHKFIEENLADGDDLYVSCRDKIRSVRGFLDEYAYYAAAMLSLYDVTAKTAYLNRAEELCREAVEQFKDKSGRGYFLYGTKNSTLITKPKETYDGALPSGNSVMAFCLVRLLQITNKENYAKEAVCQLAFMSANAREYPAGHSMFLTALLFYQNPPGQIKVVLSPNDKAEEILAKLPLYADIMLLRQETEAYKLLNGRTTYYVCKNHSCLPPSNEFSEL